MTIDLQSKAILRYLAALFGLDGRSIAEQVRIDQAEQQTVDFRNVLRQICFFEPNNLEQLLTAQQPVLQQFNEFLAPNGWILPDRVTYADFFLFETLDLLLAINKNSLKQTPNLASYHQRFSQIPEIAAYRESHEFQQLSFFYGPAKLFSKPHLI
jgi:glutathione S-transferase